MTEIPNFITHYCLPDRQPFLTLSDLTIDEEEAVFEKIRDRHKHDSGYRRRYGADYLSKRQKIESKLRYLFIDRGGKPVRKHPFYFVLGQSTWFENLNKDHLSLQVEIDRLSPETTSFTFPDSYVSLSRCDQPYHGQVFLLHELEHVVSRYGLPEDKIPLSYQRYWEGDFEKYIEFQIWEDDIVQPFIDLYWSVQNANP